MTKITQLPPTFKQRFKKFIDTKIAKRTIGILLILQIVGIITASMTYPTTHSIVKGMLIGYSIVIGAILIIVLIILIMWCFDPD